MKNKFLRAVGVVLVIVASLAIVLDLMFLYGYFSSLGQYVFGTEVSGWRYSSSFNYIFSIFLELFFAALAIGSFFYFSASHRKMILAQSISILGLALVMFL